MMVCCVSFSIIVYSCRTWPDVLYNMCVVSLAAGSTSMTKANWFASLEPATNSQPQTGVPSLTWVCGLQQKTRRGRFRRLPFLNLDIKISRRELENLSLTKLSMSPLNHGTSIFFVVQIACLLHVHQERFLRRIIYITWTPPPKKSLKSSLNLQFPTGARNLKRNSLKDDNSRENSDIWHDCKALLLQATRCGLLAEVQELTTMQDLFLGLRTEGFSYSTTGNCMGSQDPNRQSCIMQLLAGQVSSTCSDSGAARRRRRRKRATSKCRCLGEREKGRENHRQT